MLQLQKMTFHPHTPLVQLSLGLNLFSCNFCLGHAKAFFKFKDIKSKTPNTMPDTWGELQWGERLRPLHPVSVTPICFEVKLKLLYLSTRLLLIWPLPTSWVSQLATTLHPCGPYLQIPHSLCKFGFLAFLKQILLTKCPSCLSLSPHCSQPFPYTFPYYCPLPHSPPRPLKL